MATLLLGRAYAQQEKDSSDDKSQGTGTEQELLDRIEDLEKQLKRMEEAQKARMKLEITEEEKEQREKEVLEAVDTDYTLDVQHTLGVDYSLSYSYSPSETTYTLDEYLSLKRQANHTLTHSISLSYSVLDNLSMSTGLPVLYRYNKMGTDDELDETDIGDISIGVGWQPYKAVTGDVRTTVSLGATFPTGRSPYKINPDTELSTGSGYYVASLGANFSKQVDPVVVFWRLGYSHPFDITDLDYMVDETVTLKKVEPGDGFSLGAGLAYALSYDASINVSFNYSYSLSTRYTYEELAYTIRSANSTSGSFGIGFGWKISPKTTISYSLGYSLVGDGFSLSVRVPFSFML